MRRNTRKKAKNKKEKRLWLKHMLLNIQEIANNKLNMFYQKMLETFQMLIMITNKEMFSPLGTSMIHKAKLTLKIKLCNQEMENIQ